MAEYTILKGYIVISNKTSPLNISFFLIPRHFNNGKLIPFRTLAEIQDIIESETNARYWGDVEIARGEWQGFFDHHYVWYFDPASTNLTRLKFSLARVSRILSQESIFLYLNGEKHFIKPN